MANLAFMPVLLVGLLALFLLVQETCAEETYVVTTILEPPYVMEKRSSETLQGNDRYEGYLVDMIEKIAAMVGFSYELKLVEDGKYGVVTSSGEWNGMIGELITGKANMTLSPMTINYLREQVVDFSKPFMSVGIGILMKKAKRESTRVATNYLLLKPFSTGVWLCIVAAFVLVSILFFVFTRFLPTSGISNTGEDAQPEQNQRGTLSSCLDGFWLTCRSLFFQGFSGDKSPSSIAMRVLAFFWFGFVMIAVLLYVVSLNNMFPGHRIEQLPKSIQNVEDLAMQTKIKYGTVAGGNTMTFFKESNIPVYQKMWSVMESSDPSVFVRSTKEGINRTLGGSYAFIGESSTLDYAASRQCILERVGGLLSSSGYGLAFPVGSQLRDKVSFALLRMQEDQTLQMLYNKWWPTWMCGKKDNAQEVAPNCKERPLSDLVVGVDTFSGPLVFMVIGVLLAVLAAVVEIVVARATGTKQKDGLGVEDEKL